MRWPVLRRGCGGGHSKPRTPRDKAQAEALELSVPNGRGKPMSPRYDQEWINSMLDVETRLGTTSPESLLRNTGLGSGQFVADIGCGPGLFAIPAALVVGPQGGVYAVDTEQTMLDMVDEKSAEEGLSHVVTVLSDGSIIPLPDSVAHYAICGLMLHDCPDFAARVAMARDIRRTVQPGGRILVIEWTPQSGDDCSRRLTPEETGDILSAARLEFDGPHPFGEWQYMMPATRPSV